MRGLSRRLSERTRLKSIANLVLGACLGMAMGAAQSGSLLEPGATVYTSDWGEPISDDPIQIGPDHTVVLATQDDELFVLSTSFLNDGVVRTEPHAPWRPEAVMLVMSRQVNRGSWYLSDNLTTVFFEGVDNRNGFFKIGANSLVSSESQEFVGGRVHGMADTSKLLVKNLKDVTFSGYVTLVPSQPLQGPAMPSTIGGKLTVDGTLRIDAANLTESTLLRGTGKTLLNNATIGAAPGVMAPKLTIEAGHTLSGTGHITDVSLLNQGTVEVNAGEQLRVTSTIVQEGDDARLDVKGTLQAPEIQIKGGVIELHNESYVGGNIDVQKGRLVLHEVQVGSDGAAYPAPLINGDLSLSDQSEVEVIVQGGLPLAVLDVFGKVSLGGDLIVSFVDGAKVPSTFALAFSGSPVQGAFRSVRVNGAGNLPWTFIQQRNGAVEIAMVPEPETWGLMLCGLGVVAWRLRRRTAHQTVH